MKSQKWLVICKYIKKAVIFLEIKKVLNKLCTADML